MLLQMAECRREPPVMSKIAPSQNSRRCSLRAATSVYSSNQKLCRRSGAYTTMTRCMLADPLDTVQGTSLEGLRDFGEPRDQLQPGLRRRFPSMLTTRLWWVSNDHSGGAPG
jgi:hypothetical protein